MDGWYLIYVRYICMYKKNRKALKHGIYRSSPPSNTKNGGMTRPTSRVQSITNTRRRAAIANPEPAPFLSPPFNSSPSHHPSTLQPHHPPASLPPPPDPTVQDPLQGIRRARAGKALLSDVFDEGERRGRGSGDGGAGGWGRVRVVGRFGGGGGGEVVGVRVAGGADFGGGW